MKRRDQHSSLSLFFLAVTFAAISVWPSVFAAEKVFVGVPDKTEAVASGEPVPGTPVGEKGVIMGVPVGEQKPLPTGEVVEGAPVGVPGVGEQLPPLKGPKKSVAVLTFGDLSGFSEELNVGEVIADMLAAALSETERFVVIERHIIRDILHERDRAASGKSAKAQFIGVERLIPAQIGISGIVTDFSFERQGAEAGAAPSPGPVTESVHVALDIKIIDAITEEVLFSERIEKKGTYEGIQADYTDKDLAMGTEPFAETPLGKAAVEVVTQATHKIALDLAQLPWRGAVILTQAGKVYINCGKREGIVARQKFLVFNKGEELTDPETGEFLGAEETFAGRISVVEVNEKYSVARIDEGERFKRGDVLRVP